ncbi:MAG: hypothetical protein AAFR35_10185 [Pseudomonadota bacterium]
MTGFYDRLMTAARKRAAYNRTVAEIEALPQNVALDLDIYPGDARKIARQAVYGG